MSINNNAQIHKVREGKNSSVKKTPLLTKKQVKKAGDEIRKSQEGGAILHQHLKILDSWREIHRYPLEQVKAKINKEIKNLNLEITLKSKP